MQLCPVFLGGGRGGRMKCMRMESALYAYVTIGLVGVTSEPLKSGMEIGMQMDLHYACTFYEGGP
jgi:hypothetical protein